MNQFNFLSALPVKAWRQTNFSLEQTYNDSPLGVISHQAASHWHFLQAQDELSRSFELIKVLRQHQQNKRWTLLIAPEHIPDKALLECCSVDMSHVLIVREKQISSIMEAIETALNCNTCCAIVAWCEKWHNQISIAKQKQLIALANQNQCHVYTFAKQIVQNPIVEH